MVEVVFNFGWVHFATVGGKSVPKDQLSVALFKQDDTWTFHSLFGALLLMA